MTNLLQLPQFFDLEIYTTGRLEKVNCDFFHFVVCSHPKEANLITFFLFSLILTYVAS